MDERNLEQLAAELDQLKRKRWVEIVLMPLVIAVTGTMGTWIITRYQTQNSAAVARAQLASAERLARAELQLKALDVYSDKIASRDVAVRTQAVQLLSLVEPELATHLASMLAASRDQPRAVRDAARTAVAELLSGYSFPVIGSWGTLSAARTHARQLASKGPYEVEVYLAESGFYAVTIGGYLSYSEAAKRVAFAKGVSLAADAYVATGRAWGNNLLTPAAQH